MIISLRSESYTRRGKCLVFFFLRWWCWWWCPSVYIYFSHFAFFQTQIRQSSSAACTWTMMTSPLNVANITRCWLLYHPGARHAAPCISTRPQKLTAYHQVTHTRQKSQMPRFSGYFSNLYENILCTNFLFFTIKLWMWHVWWFRVLIVKKSYTE